MSLDSNKVTLSAAAPAGRPPEAEGSSGGNADLKVKTWAFLAARFLPAEKEIDDGFSSYLQKNLYSVLSELSKKYQIDLYEYAGVADREVDEASSLRDLKNFLALSGISSAAELSVFLDDPDKGWQILEQFRGKFEKKSQELVFSMRLLLSAPLSGRSEDLPFVKAIDYALLGKLELIFGEKLYVMDGGEVDEAATLNNYKSLLFRLGMRNEEQYRSFLDFASELDKNKDKLVKAGDLERDLAAWKKIRDDFEAGIALLAPGLLSPETDLARIDPKKYMGNFGIKDYSSWKSFVSFITSYREKNCLAYRFLFDEGRKISSLLHRAESFIEKPVKHARACKQEIEDIKNRKQFIVVLRDPTNTEGEPTYKKVSKKNGSVVVEDVANPRQYGAYLVGISPLHEKLEPDNKAETDKGKKKDEQKDPAEALCSKRLDFYAGIGQAEEYLAYLYVLQGFEYKHIENLSDVGMLERDIDALINLNKSMGEKAESLNKKVEKSKTDDLSADEREIGQAEYSQVEEQSNEAETRRSELYERYNLNGLDKEKEKIDRIIGILQLIEIATSKMGVKLPILQEEIARLEDNGFLVSKPGFDLKKNIIYGVIDDKVVEGVDNVSKTRKTEQSVGLKIVEHPVAIFKSGLKALETLVPLVSGQKVKVSEGCALSASDLIIAAKVFSPRYKISLPSEKLTTAQRPSVLKALDNNKDELLQRLGKALRGQDVSFTDEELGTIRGSLSAEKGDMKSLFDLLFKKEGFNNEYIGRSQDGLSLSDRAVLLGYAAKNPKLSISSLTENIPADAEGQRVYQILRGISYELKLKVTIEEPTGPFAKIWKAAKDAFSEGFNPSKMLAEQLRAIGISDPIWFSFIWRKLVDPAARQEVKKAYDDFVKAPSDKNTAQLQKLQEVLKKHGFINITSDKINLIFADADLRTLITQALKDKEVLQLLTVLPEGGYCYAERYNSKFRSIEEFSGFVRSALFDDNTSSFSSLEVSPGEKIESRVAKRILQYTLMSAYFNKLATDPRNDAALGTILALQAVFLPAYSFTLLAGIIAGASRFSMEAFDLRESKQSDQYSRLTVAGKFNLMDVPVLRKIIKNYSSASQTTESGVMNVAPDVLSMISAYSSNNFSMVGALLNTDGAGSPLETVTKEDLRAFEKIFEEIGNNVQNTMMENPEISARFDGLLKEEGLSGFWSRVSAGNFKLNLASVKDRTELTTNTSLGKRASQSLKLILLAESVAAECRPQKKNEASSTLTTSSFKPVKESANDEWGNVGMARDGYPVEEQNTSFVGEAALAAGEQVEDFISMGVTFTGTLIGKTVELTEALVGREPERIFKVYTEWLKLSIGVAEWRFCPVALVAPEVWAKFHQGEKGVAEAIGILVVALRFTLEQMQSTILSMREGIAFLRNQDRIAPKRPINLFDLPIRMFTDPAFKVSKAIIDKLASPEKRASWEKLDNLWEKAEGWLSKAQNILSYGTGDVNPEWGKMAPSSAELDTKNKLVRLLKSPKKYNTTGSASKRTGRFLLIDLAYHTFWRDIGGLRFMDPRNLKKRYHSNEMLDDRLHLGAGRAARRDFKTSVKLLEAFFGKLDKEITKSLELSARAAGVDPAEYYAARSKKKANGAETISDLPETSSAANAQPESRSAEIIDGIAANVDQVWSSIKNEERPSTFEELGKQLKNIQFPSDWDNLSLEKQREYMESRKIEVGGRTLSYLEARLLWIRHLYYSETGKVFTTPQLKSVLALHYDMSVQKETGGGKTIIRAAWSVLDAPMNRKTYLFTYEGDTAMADYNNSEVVGMYKRAGLKDEVALVKFGDPKAELNLRSKKIVYLGLSDGVFSHLQGLAAGRRSLFAFDEARFSFDEVDYSLFIEGKSPFVLALNQKPLTHEEEEVIKDADRIIKRSTMSDVAKISHMAPDKIIEYLCRKIPKWEKLPTEMRNAYRGAMGKAFQAYTGYQRGRDYTVKNGKIALISAENGRLMEGRQLEGGLHQALEAKEGCLITPYQGDQLTMQGPEFFGKVRNKNILSGTATVMEKALKLFGFNDVYEAERNVYYYEWDGERSPEENIFRLAELLNKGDLRISRNGKPIVQIKISEADFNKLPKEQVRGLNGLFESGGKKYTLNYVVDDPERVFTTQDALIDGLVESAGNDLTKYGASPEGETAEEATARMEMSRRPILIVSEDPKQIKQIKEKLREKYSDRVVIDEISYGESGEAYEKFVSTPIDEGVPKGKVKIVLSTLTRRASDVKVLNPHGGKLYLIGRWQWLQEIYQALGRLGRAGQAAERNVFSVLSEVKRIDVGLAKDIGKKIEEKGEGYKLTPEEAKKINEAHLEANIAAAKKAYEAGSKVLENTEKAAIYQSIKEKISPENIDEKRTSKEEYLKWQKDVQRCVFEALFADFEDEIDFSEAKEKEEVSRRMKTFREAFGIQRGFEIRGMFEGKLSKEKLIEYLSEKVKVFEGLEHGAVRRIVLEAFVTAGENLKTEIGEQVASSKTPDMILLQREFCFRFLETLAQNVNKTNGRLGKAKNRLEGFVKRNVRLTPSSIPAPAPEKTAGTQPLAEQEGSATGLPAHEHGYAKIFTDAGIKVVALNGAFSGWNSDDIREVARDLGRSLNVEMLYVADGVKLDGNLENIMKQMPAGGRKALIITGENEAAWVDFKDWEFKQTPDGKLEFSCKAKSPVKFNGMIEAVTWLREGALPKKALLSNEAGFVLVPTKEPVSRPKAVPIKVTPMGVAEQKNPEAVERNYFESVKTLARSFGINDAELSNINSIEELDAFISEKRKNIKLDPEALNNFLVSEDGTAFKKTEQGKRFIEFYNDFRYKVNRGEILKGGAFGLLTGLATIVGAEKLAEMMGIDNPLARFIFVLGLAHTSNVTAQKICKQGLERTLAEVAKTYQKVITTPTLKGKIAAAGQPLSRIYGIDFGVNLIKGFGAMYLAGRAYDEAMNALGVASDSPLRTTGGFVASFAAPSLAEGGYSLFGNYVAKKLGEKGARTALWRFLGGALRVGGVGGSCLSWGGAVLMLGEASYSLFSGKYSVYVEQRIAEKYESEEGISIGDRVEKLFLLNNHNARIANLPLGMVTDIKFDVLAEDRKELENLRAELAGRLFARALSASGTFDRKHLLEFAKNTLGREIKFGKIVIGNEVFPDGTTVEKTVNEKDVFQFVIKFVNDSKISDLSDKQVVDAVKGKFGINDVQYSAFIEKVGIKMFQDKFASLYFLDPDSYTYFHSSCAPEDRLNNDIRGMFTKEGVLKNGKEETLVAWVLGNANIVHAAEEIKH